MTIADPSAEAAAHALLRLTSDHPGEMGRVRAARVIGGMQVPYRNGDEEKEFARYAAVEGWHLDELLSLVDAMLQGGLVKQTPGPRPVVVLTRAGHRALEALELTEGVA